MVECERAREMRVDREIIKIRDKKNLKIVRRRFIPFVWCRNKILCRKRCTIFDLAAIAPFGGKKEFEEIKKRDICATTDFPTFADEFNRNPPDPKHVHHKSSLLRHAITL